MRKSMALLLVSVLSVLCVAPVQASQFSDVATVAPDLLEAITVLTNQHVIQGYPDGSFRPQAPISEKEWGLLVGRMITNVDISGLSDQPISRLGALYLLSAMWHIDWHRESLSSHYSDVYSNADMQVVGYFDRLGIVHGRSSVQFVPSGTLTRAEAAKILLLADQSLHRHQSIITPTPTPVATTTLSITQNVVEIVDVAPLNLGPGQTGTLLFTIKNNGDLQTGLESGRDYTVSVLSGDVRIVAASEISNGLYQVLFQASTNASAGPVNIQITAFMGSVFRTDLNEFLSHRYGAQITSPQVSLAQLIPSHLYSGQKAQIIVTPQGIGGSSVSGLDISAEVTHGSGTIVAPIQESPVGSGVYIGTYQASGSGRQDVEITVRINNVSSRPETVIHGTIQ